MKNNTNGAGAPQENEPNVQAQPPAPAGENLAPSGEAQESQEIPPAPGAGDGCAAATCSAPKGGFFGGISNRVRHWIGLAISPLICHILSLEREGRREATKREMLFHEERRSDRKWLRSQATKEE